ncbi:Fyv10p [Malassezia vespertilionis]|uniref:Fyv10p n=1 Tax=Malassezia vespertilionis TaxID=2020962 RepID=A0A2N1J9A8_9BASI|nr:Fyv10p [Malassezia vespertilionis]
MALSSGGPKDMTSHGITDAAGVPSEEDIFALEHSFLSLPVEELRMQLKAQQRNTEKGFAYCKALSESLLTHITNGDWSDNVAREKTKHALRSELARLRALRDRMASFHHEANDVCTSVEARIEHLGVVFTFAEDAEAFNDWCATRLVRMVADYMLRHNCDKSTALLAQQRKIEALVDFPVFSQIRKVKESLVPDKVSGRAPSCSLALAWCTENKTALRKFKSTLEFDLRLQEFIELTRSRTSCSLRDAVVYAQKQLMPWLHAQDEADDLDKDGPARNNVTYTRAQAVRAMGLLAFGPDMWSYHDLYNVERWKYLCDTFLQIALRVYEIPPVPLLHIALSAGLSSLKSHACCSTHYHDKIGTVATNLSIAKDEKHPECPVCDANGLGELAKEVPFNHHANSILICRINGKVMDDKNPPMCLPNGMVYSETALHDLATRSADSATGISRTVSSKMQNAFLDTEKHVPFDCKEPGEKIDVYHPAESPADGCATGEENAMTPTLREQSELLWNGGRRGNLGKLDTRQNIMPRANAAPLQDSGMEASAPWHTFLRDRAYLPQSLLGNPNPRQLEAIQSPDAMSPTSPLRQATSDPTEDTYSTWSSMKTIPASRTDIKKGSSLRSATNLSSFSADDHSQSSWLESSSDSSLNTRLPSPPSRFDSLHSISGFQYQPSGGALAYRNAAGPYSSSSAKANVDESSSLTMDFGPGSSGSHFGSGIRAQLATTLSSLIEKVPLEIPEGCVRTISIAEFGCLNSRSLLLLRLVIEEFIERVKMMQHGASSPSTQDKKDLALPPEPFPIVFNVIHEDSPQADYRSFTHLLDTHPDSYMNPIWQSSCGPCLQNFLYPSFVARPFGSRIVPPNTLDVGFSLMDLHWMHTPNAQGVALATTAQAELTTFLYARSHEFKQGGVFIMAFLARQEVDPNGVIDNKTDAFIAQRAMHRSAVELEEQRLERRLAKLVSLYSPEFEKEADAIALSPDAAPFLRRQGVQLFSLFQGKEEARKSQLLQKRTVAEQSIVKWQSDSKIPNLHSEELAIPRKPCSSLKLVNPDTYKIDNMPPHPSSTASPAERDKYAAAEFLAIRLCKDCTGLLHRIYYHQHSQETTQFTI